MKRTSLRAWVPFAWAARPARFGVTTRGGLVALAGCCLLAVFGVFIVLLVNFPPRTELIFGVAHESPALFGALWTYPNLSLSPQSYRVATFACIVCLWLAYAASIAALPRGLTLPRRLLISIGGQTLALVLLVLLFMPPILSTDIYLYGIYGRMQSVYGLNPFLTTARDISSDLLYPHIVWRDVPSFYGPHWSLVERLVAGVAGDSILGIAFGFKLVATAAHLANAGLIFLICRRLVPGRELHGFLLYAWNPLILTEAIGSAHNDTYMLTFALAGILCALYDRRALAVACITLSFLSKYVTGLLLIFVLAYWLARAENRRQIVRLLVMVLGVSTGVTAVLYLPFLNGVANPLQLFAGGSLMQTVLYNPMRMLINAAGRSLGFSELAVSLGLHGAFAVFVGWLLWPAIRQRAAWLRTTALWGAAHAVYLLFVFGGFFPWYMVTPLAAGFLSAGSGEGRWLRAAALDVSLALMLLYGLAIEAQPAIGL